MIAQVNTPRQRQRFLNACRGKLCCGATLPLALQLLGKAQPGRFFAGPTLALDIGGRTAWAAGHANPEELASFLNFCGCRAVILDEAECPPPVGWQKTCDHTIFGLAAGEQLPLPAQTEAQKALWDSLTFVEDPASGPVAENLFPDRPARRDDFYSELCTKRSRGKALVWTLEQGGNIVCTVGAYALCNGQAYMACGQTAEALRGQRVGGRLIVQMANALYLEQPALWQRDDGWEGFTWLSADDNTADTIAFLRWDQAGRPLAVVCNFSPVHRRGYRLGVPFRGRWTPVFNTDRAEFGGSDLGDRETLTTERVPCHGQEQSLVIDLPPMAVMVYRCTHRFPAGRKKVLPAGAISEPEVN